MSYRDSYGGRSPANESMVDLPSMPSMHAYESDEDSYGQSSSRRSNDRSRSFRVPSPPAKLASSVASSSSHPPSARRPDTRNSSASTLRLPDQSMTPGSRPGTPAGSQGSVTGPYTSTPRSHVDVLAPGSDNSQTRFASSGPWAETPIGNNRSRNNTFDAPSIIKEDSVDYAEEEQSAHGRALSFGPDDSRQLDSNHSLSRQEQSAGDVDRGDDSFGSVGGGGDQEDEGDQTSQHHSYHSDRQPGGDGDQPHGEDSYQQAERSMERSFVDANISQPQPQEEVSRVESDHSFGDAQQEDAVETVEQRSSRLIGSRQPTAELSLVLEVEEELTEEDGDASVDSRASGFQESQTKSTYIQLGRRRSQASRRMAVEPPILSHSPASVSNSSDSTTSTPNGASQTSGHRSLVRSNTSLDDRDVEDQPGNELSMGGDNMSGLLSPVKEYSVSISGTPAPRRNSAVIQATPRNEYYVALQEVSPNSQAGGAPSPASYATPKAPAFLTHAERRKDLVLSTLSSTSRPRIRGTPHTRRSIGGASLLSIRQQSESPYSGGGPSFHSILHPDDQQHLQPDQSFLSIASSEDLTTLNRAANTSLPVISDARHNNGIKLQKHLHGLNTQQHLQIQKLEEENTILRAGWVERVGEDLPEGVGKTIPSRFEREGTAESAASVGEGNLELLGRMADEIATLKDALAARESELETVRKAPAPRAASLNPVVEDLSPELESIQSELAASKAELSEAADLLSQRSEELVASQAKLAEVEQAKTRQVSDFALKTEKLESDILEILTEKEAELAVARQERDSLDEALKMKEGGRESVAEERVARLTAEVETLKGEVGTGKDRIQALTVEVRAAQESLQAQTQELETAKAAVQTGDDERHAILEKLGAADRSTQEVDVVEMLESVLANSDEQLNDQQDKLQQLEDEAGQRIIELERVEGLLQSTTEDLAASTDEVSSLKAQLAEMEDVLGEQDTKLGEAEEQLTAQEEKIAQLEEQGQGGEEQTETLRAKVLELELQLSEATTLRDSQADQLVQLEEAHSAAVDQLQASYKDQITVLENALKDAEDRTGDDQVTIARLNTLIQELETSKEALAAQAATAGTRSPSPGLQTPGPSRHRFLQGSIGTPVNEDAIVSQLKSDLETANREIGRLQKEVAATPFKRTAIESRDMRIRALESANASSDLRKTILRGQSVEPNGDETANSTIVYPSIQSPRTPHSLGPLREMSFLDGTPVPSRIADTLAQIERLKDERDEQIESADENWEVQKDLLLDQLTEALEEIGRLQRELAGEQQMSERLRGEVEEIGASAESGSVLSSQLASLERDLSSARNELATAVRAKTADRASFDRKETALKSDIAKLKDELDRQRKLVSDARSEQRTIKTDLARAQAKVSGLESDVASLQKKTATLSDDLARSDRDKASVEGEANAAKEDLESALAQLQEARDKVDSLQDLADSRSAALTELELRSKSTSSTKDVHSRELEDLVRSKAQLEAKLRSAHQRSQDMAKHSDTLTSQLTTERLACHQLRASLSSRDQADRVAHEEREQIHRTIKSLRSDLKVVRSEAESLGRDLLNVKTDGADAQNRQRLEQMAAQLGDQLERARNDESALKSRHKQECKALLLDIRYLKVKFTRENTFREDLSLQKEYLLILIGKLSRQQSRVHAAIAQMGYPGPQPTVTRPRRTLKSVAIAVVMIIRARNLARNWAKTSEVALALREAHDRQRGGSPGGGRR